MQPYDLCFDGIAERGGRCEQIAAVEFFAPTSQRSRAPPGRDNRFGNAEGDRVQPDARKRFRRAFSVGAKYRNNASQIEMETLGKKDTGCAQQSRIGSRGRTIRPETESYAG